jgi:hypothetical protein
MTTAALLISLPAWGASESLTCQSGFTITCLPPEQPPPPALTGVTLGNSNFQCGTAGKVGQVTVQGTGDVSGVQLSLSGADAGQFTLSRTSAPADLKVKANPQGCPRSYGLNIVATLAGATGSPLSKAQTVTGTEPVTELPPGGGGGTPPSAALFPPMGSQPSSVYPWADYPPGVTYNGGIPARSTQCGATLRPKGGGASDAAQIKAAVDACPAGQHVQLGAGVFAFGPSDMVKLEPRNSNVTIRGVGPGPGSAVPNQTTSLPNPACAASSCTILYQKDPGGAFNAFFWVNQFAADASRYGPAINLSADGVQGSTTIQLASAPSGSSWAVGRLAVIDVVTGKQGASDYDSASIWPTAANPELRYTKAFGSPGNQWYVSTYGRAWRHLSQIVKITAINGSAVTIQSPLGMTFATANQAQLASWSPGTADMVQGIGIEDMYFYGGGGQGYANGSVKIELCDGCWIKHVESHWSEGAAIGMILCYRCELRDSYIHEPRMFKGTSNGGRAYLLTLDTSTANSLVENNILWNGNKQMTMRSSGGGNVIGYNYMDDAWGEGMPAQEAGANAGHYLGSHMELFEGNWSHKYSGDSWWGNAIYITAFRNVFSGLRTANDWLTGHTFGNGYPYYECWARTALTMQPYQWWHNVVGNVFGFAGQEGTLNTTLKGCDQTGSRYENPFDGSNADRFLTMYEIGKAQDNEGFGDDPSMYQKVNRQGNFDFVTGKQIWYETFGGKGTTSTGSSQELPNSLYLTAKPAFFGSSTWPWVDPSTGTIYTLPAQARFVAGTPNLM